MANIAENSFVLENELQTSKLSFSGVLKHFWKNLQKMSLETKEIGTHICSCHNFFPLSSVQILLIPACCLLCVLQNDI